MKRFAPILAVVIACLVLAPAAFTKAPNTCKSHGFRASGSLTAIDSENGVLSIAVDKGSPGIGDSLDVNITDATEFYLVSGPGDEASITLDDLKVGDKVNVRGAIDKSSDTPVYSATEVRVRVAKFSCQGSLTAIDSENGVLSIAVDKGSPGIGDSLDVNVTDATEFYLVSGPGDETAITLDDLKVGDKVNVRGAIDKSSDTPVYSATEVRVRVAKFGCQGSLTAIDSENGVLSIAVDHGSPGIGDSLDVNVTDATEIYLITGTSSDDETSITLDDLKVGDKVAVCGIIDNSSDTPAYNALFVLDGVTAELLPSPQCKPTSLSVKAANARKGHALKIGLKVADAMPGCSSAKVTLTLTTAAGKKIASTSVSGVAVNKAVKVAFKLKKSLAKGTYKILTSATDSAGNKQAKAATAKLKVK